MPLEQARILIVGAGGLGSPAGRALAMAGVGHLRVVDDDVVDLSNLHRQVLYQDADVGASKAPLAARRLAEIARASGHATTTDCIEGRFVPSSAEALLEDIDLVVEGADNLPTKFLVADACALAGVACVQAGAVRWSGWALACRNETPHQTCMRCVFEDMPADRVETCAVAGVIGPVVGVLGAIQARLALQLLGGEDVAGRLWSYRGLHGSLRETKIRPRADCPHVRGEIRDLRPERYVAHCAA